MISSMGKAPLTKEAFERSFQNIMSEFTDTYITQSKLADEENGELDARERLEEFFKGLDSGSLLAIAYAATKIAQVLITEHELKMKRGDFGPAFPPANPNVEGLARDDVKCEMHTMELQPGQNPMEAIKEFLRARGINPANANIQEIK